jgi:hypothetical protein
MALESSFVLFLLSVITVCAIVMTIAVLMTARDARRTFRRINALLPSCRYTLAQAQKLLASVHHTVSQAELVVSAVSSAVAHTLHQFIDVQHRVERWFHRSTHDNGTGAGSGARPFRHRMKG